MSCTQLEGSREPSIVSNHLVTKDQVHNDEHPPISDHKKVHQIPIKLSDGRVVRASFTKLEDPMPPPWSIFYPCTNKNGGTLKVPIDFSKGDNFTKTSSLPGKVKENEIAELWNEIQELGKLPQSPFPLR